MWHLCLKNEKWGGFFFARNCISGRFGEGDGCFGNVSFFAIVQLFAGIFFLFFLGGGK